MAPSANHIQPKPKRKLNWKVLLVVVLFIAACAGIYLWQSMKYDTAAQELSTANERVSQLEQQIAGETTAADNQNDRAVSSPTSDNPNLIPGNVDTGRDDDRVLITAIYKYSIEPTAVWVEYGTSPTKLDQTSEKLTQSLGLGDSEDGYATGAAVSILSADLKPGATYYYRTAATVDGKTQQSAIASFSNSK